VLFVLLAGAFSPVHPSSAQLRDQIMWQIVAIVIALIVAIGGAMFVAIRFMAKYYVDQISRTHEVMWKKIDANHTEISKIKTEV